MASTNINNSATLPAQESRVLHSSVLITLGALGRSASNNRSTEVRAMRAVGEHAFDPYRVHQHRSRLCQFLALGEPANPSYTDPLGCSSSFLRAFSFVGFT
jgi:hypothetical protein